MSSLVLFDAKANWGSLKRNGLNGSRAPCETLRLGASYIRHLEFRGGNRQCACCMCSHACYQRHDMDSAALSLADITLRINSFNDSKPAAICTLCNT